MSVEDIQLQSGPCIVCGLTNYPLSMGGPLICPACDCGIGNVEKLKSDLKWSRESHGQSLQELERLKVLDKERRATINQLMDLCLRAADRIHMWVDAGLDPSQETKELIDELRRAAPSDTALS